MFLGLAPASPDDIALVQQHRDLVSLADYQARDVPTPEAARIYKHLLATGKAPGAAVVYRLVECAVQRLQFVHKKPVAHFDDGDLKESLAGVFEEWRLFNLAKWIRRGEPRELPESLSLALNEGADFIGTVPIWATKTQHYELN